MNRRSPTILGQERTMQIDASVLRSCKKPRRKNLSICDNDNQIRRQRADQLACFVCPQRWRLMDRQVQLKCSFLYRRSLQQLAATAWFIRLSDDGGYGRTRFE